MFIVQCKYSEAGEKQYWHDLNKWDKLIDAEKDLTDCKKLYKKNKTYKWRIIKRIETYSKIEKVRCKFNSCR